VVVSLSALLTQDLATRSAESASAAGTGAVAGYGNILAQLTGQEVNAAGNLEDLVNDSLLTLLGIDKGSMQRGSIITEGERRNKGTVITDFNSDTNTNTNTNSNTNTRNNSTNISNTVGQEKSSGKNSSNQSQSGSQQAGNTTWGNSVVGTKRLPTGSMANINR